MPKRLNEHDTPPPLRVLVGIPVYNEEQYVQPVLDEVRRYASDILVIDDGSTDDTPMRLARAAGRGDPARREPRLRPIDAGHAPLGAIRRLRLADHDGLRRAARAGGDPAVRRGHPHADDCDVISGSRYLLETARSTMRRPDDRRRHQPHDHRGAATRGSGCELTDAFCGFKAYRVAACSHLDLRRRRLRLSHAVLGAGGGARV